MRTLTGYSLAVIVLSVTGVGTAVQAGDPVRPSDAYGRMDTIRVEISQSAGTRWEADVYLSNDENLAAMTLPLRWGPKHGFYRLDSASYAKSRIEDFAVKTFYPDTVKQTVLLGLISDIGKGVPPLAAGHGLIARLHFTNVKPGAKPLTVDTTFIPPHNILQMVTPDIASIYPFFVVKTVEAAPKR